MIDGLIHSRMQRQYMLPPKYDVRSLSPICIGRTIHEGIDRHNISIGGASIHVVDSIHICWKLYRNNNSVGSTVMFAGVIKMPDAENANYNLPRPCPVDIGCTTGIRSLY